MRNEDYPHEVDTFEIPEEYLEMTPEELEREEKRLFAEMKAHPKTREPMVRFVENKDYMVELLNV